MPGQGNQRVLPIFKMVGKEQLFKEHVRDKKAFFRDMTDLFAVSGLGGEFTLSAQNMALGTSHTKGLTVKTLGRGGVIMTANYGNNSDNLQFLVVAPNGDNNQLFRLLRAGVHKLSEDEGDDMLKRHADYGNAGLGIFQPDLKKFAELERRRTLAATPKAAPQPVPAPVTIPPEQPSAERKPFYKDTTRLALFMEELEKHATPEGLITRYDCLEVLSTNFAAASNASGAMLKGIIGDGHLTADSENMLRFGGVWLTEWQGKCSKQAVSTPPAAPAPAGDLLGNFLQLTVLDEEMKKMSERRVLVAQTVTDLGREVAETEEKLCGLRGLLTDASEEMKSIETKLAESKYADAAKQIDAIRKFLLPK
jgi:hypothetical protein